MGQPTRHAHFPAGFNTSYIIGRGKARSFHLSAAHFCLRISRVLRMDSLLVAIFPPGLGGGGRLRLSSVAPLCSAPLRLERGDITPFTMSEMGDHDARNE